jgi:hypothetical protein
MNFTRQQSSSHEIIHKFTLGSLVTCTETPRTKQSITNMPLPRLMASGVLAGGKVLAGDGLVLCDLQALRCPPMGDVHQSQLRSMVGGVQWRRPCRGVVVPGEGPANMGRQGAHEHRGSAGMLSPNSIWTKLGQRGVIDGGVELGFSPAAMVAGVL